MILNDFCVGAFPFRDLKICRENQNTSKVSCRWNSTPDLYRVNFEVNNLKPFACLAFPQTAHLKTPRKQLIFGDELVTSFLLLYRKETIRARSHAVTPVWGAVKVPQPQKIQNRRKLASAILPVARFGHRPVFRTLAPLTSAFRR